MTYNVFGGSLNLLNQLSFKVFNCKCLLQKPTICPLKLISSKYIILEQHQILLQ